MVKMSSKIRKQKPVYISSFPINISQTMNIKTILVISFATMMLSACGRRNLPEQLEPNGYPHVYPRPAMEVFDGGSAG